MNFSWLSILTEDRVHGLAHFGEAALQCMRRGPYSVRHFTAFSVVAKMRASAPQRREKIVGRKGPEPCLVYLISGGFEGLASEHQG
jgi:hypothetical protein